MLKLKFYGQYKSSVVSTSGCTKAFVTQEIDTWSFPPQVNYKCDLCKKVHGFRFMHGWMLSTESQLKRFENYCKENNLETSVELP